MQQTTQAAAADFYHPVEHAIIADFLGIPRPPQAAGIDLQALAGTEVDGVVFIMPPGEFVDDDAALSNAVARIVLAHVQYRLPQCGIFYEKSDRLELLRKYWSSPESRGACLAQLLFSINWASSAPGVDWPEQYNLGWLAGYDRFVVTRSMDSTDVWGYNDQVMGVFGPEQELLAGVHDIVVADWQRQFGGWGQQRWEMILDTGVISWAEAEAWADEVWGEQEEQA